MKFYADHIASVWAAMQGDKTIVAQSVSPENKLQLFRDAVRSHLNYASRVDLDNDHSDDGERAWFSRFIAPLAGFGERSTLAISLQLEGDPGEVDCPIWIREVASEVISQHASVYVDIPEGQFLLGGGVLQARAVFIRHFPEGNRFCAVLTRPGSNAGWRFAWLEGRHQRSPRGPLWDDIWAMDSREISNPYRPVNSNKLDFREFAKLECVSLAALAQWSDGQDEALVRRPAAVSNCAALASLISDEQDKSTEEAFTLFRQIRPRRVRVDTTRIRGRETTDTTTRKRYSQHDVSGFYRWQPYGPNRSLRRRQWVEGFTRGRGPQKTRMIPVTTNFE